jgi:hypothetical protein
LFSNPLQIPGLSFCYVSSLVRITGPQFGGIMFI